MNSNTSASPEATDPVLFSGERWFDPIEEAVRSRVRGFIEEMLEIELDGVLQRSRYARKTSMAPPAPVGHRHGHRQRVLVGTFGPVEINVPRARLEAMAAQRKGRAKALKLISAVRARSRR